MDGVTGVRFWLGMSLIDSGNFHTARSLFQRSGCCVFARFGIVTLLLSLAFITSSAAIVHLAYHDPLTGLLNRAAVQEHANRKIAAGEPFALILIDLDNFKTVNDTYGHLIGDDYLKHIADLLELHAKPGDITGRIGGDEFVLLMPIDSGQMPVYQEAHSVYSHSLVTLFLSIKS